VLSYFLSAVLFYSCILIKKSCGCSRYKCQLGIQRFHQLNRSSTLILSKALKILAESAGKVYLCAPFDIPIVMKDLKRAFSLPIKGLHDGHHAYSFIVDVDFFKDYEGSVINRAYFDVSLALEKKPSLLVFDFSCEGYIEVPCDRCLTEIKVDMQAEQQNLVKYSDVPAVEDDITFIPHECSEFDVSDMIYEMIHLHIPISFTKDCETEGYQNCDLKTLDYLISEKNELSEEEGNDIWNDLKNIKFN